MRLKCENALMRLTVIYQANLASRYRKAMLQGAICSEKQVASFMDSDKGARLEKCRQDEGLLALIYDSYYWSKWLN